MEVKKGYKQTEVGIIPQDWDVLPLLSTVRIANGQVDPKAEPFRSMVLVAPDHIESCTGRLLKKATAFEQRAISGKYLFKSQDIVYSKIRPYLRKAVLVDFQGLCSADMYPLTSMSNVCPGFIFAIILGHHFSKYAESVSVRSGMPKINRIELADYRVPLPPTLAEQEAIATALSDADAWIESLEQLIAKKRQIKQGAMQELLTGKRRLPGFSGEWERKMLPEVSQFRGGKAHEQYIADNATYICVNSKFISTEGKVRKYSTENFCCARAQDILMVMSDLPNGKALAKTFVADTDNLYAVNQRVCALTPRENYSAQFLAFVLDRNPYFLRFDDGVSQTHLLNRVFEKCPIVVPPTKAEQNSIATILSDMDTEIAMLETKLTKARQIKQGMMQELLTGRIRLI